MKTYQKGFIALFSVIIISFILLFIAVTLNFSGFFGRFNVFDSELKSESDALAEACLESARLALATENYTLNEEIVVTIEDEICSYEISGGGEIIAWAESNSAFTYYFAEVDTGEPDLPYLDFSECVDLSPCP